MREIGLRALWPPSVCAAAQFISHSGKLAQAFDLVFDIELVEAVIVQSVDDPLCDADRTKHEHLIVVLDHNVEAASRIDVPVPFCLALQSACLVGLSLELDYEMLK